MTTTSTFACSVCHAEKPVTTGMTTGYGINPDGSKTCFDCCVVVDRIAMRDGDRVTLYYAGGSVRNWPGTLSLTPTRVRKGRHNIGRTRVDVWFREDEFGTEWHGVNIGDSDILHCRKLKAKRRTA